MQILVIFFLGGGGPGRSYLEKLKKFYRETKNREALYDIDICSGLSYPNAHKAYQKQRGVENELLAYFAHFLPCNQMVDSMDSFYLKLGLPQYVGFTRSKTLFHETV